VTGYSLLTTGRRRPWIKPFPYYSGGFDQIIIGIDPGKYPGVAVLGNNKTISVHHVSVGDVCPLIRRTMRELRIRSSLSG